MKSASAALIDRYLNGPLSVLALWAPWSALLVAPDPGHDGAPAKLHETRHWVPRLTLPFPVVVHSTKTFNSDCKVAFGHPRFRDALKRSGFYPGDPRALLEGKFQSDLRPVPLGALIGVATIVSVHKTDAKPWAHDDDRTFGDFTAGRFAWRAADTLLFPESIPFLGRQDALYPPPIEARTAIDAKLRAMRGVA